MYFAESPRRRVSGIFPQDYSLVSIRLKTFIVTTKLCTIYPTFTSHIREHYGRGIKGCDVSGAVSGHPIIKSILGGGKRGTRLTINYSAGKEIGHGFARGSTRRISMRSVRIVLDLQEYNGKPYYILTAFPTP
ncbi:RNase A-like domain-containing protein [Serratia rubidaea]|uniref:RNase A-like domain-containing protein n=1 Tax=Serratia rubidaea TaxID=61652 RepID=UPI001BB064CD|nr:hypothetical protein [Serratia rubidaea]